MTHILHIDTSGATGIVFLASNGQLIAVRRNELERDHASGINAMIAAVLEEANILVSDLNAIAVCGGPGSYTGLRIGLATAKGLCFALDIPLILDDRLRMLGWQGIKDAPDAELYLSLLPARADEYFMAVYNRQTEVVLAPAHYTGGQVKEQLAHYDEKCIAIIGYSIYSKPLTGEKGFFLYLNYDQVNPDVWAEKSFLSWKDQEFADTARAEPFYLKSVFISKKK